MDDLVGTAVRVTAERHRADEWAIVRAAGSIPHRLRPRLDGWALIVAARDAEAAREALDAYDRENVADAPHVIGNTGASVVLVGAVSHQLGPGVGLWLLLRPLRPSAQWALVVASWRRRSARGCGLYPETTHHPDAPRTAHAEESDSA